MRHAEQIAGRGPRAAAGGGARARQRPPRHAARSRWRRKRGGRAPRRRRSRPRARAERVRDRAGTTHAPRELLFFNGIGGFTPDGREYVIATAAGQRPAGALGQRARQPALRHASCRKRAAPTPGARTPTSCGSRRGTTTRSATPAARRSTCATRRAASSGRRPRCPATATGTATARPAYVTRHGFGYSVFEHDEAGIHSELTVFVAHRRRRSSSRVLRAAQRQRPRRAACRPPAMSSGCWATCARRPRRTSPPRSPSDNGALYARNAYSNDFGDWVAFFDVDAADRLSARSPATAPSSSAATARCGGPAALRRARPVGPHRRRARPVRARSRCRSSWRRGRRARSSSASAWAAAPTRPAQLVQRFRGGAAARAALDAVHGALEAHAGRGAGAHARPGAEPAGQRLAALPDAGLPHVGAQRLLPVGRRLRLPRPAAGRDGPGAHPPAPAARAPAAVRQPPVRRGRRAALVAPAVGPRRAHALLRRLPVAAAGAVPLRAGHRRHRRAGRERAASSTAAPVAAGRRVLLRPAAAAPIHAASLYEHARARAACTACASARTACR